MISGLENITTFYVTNFGGSYKRIYDDNIDRIISDNVRGIDKYVGRIKLYGDFYK